MIEYIFHNVRLVTYILLFTTAEGKEIIPQNTTTMDAPNDWYETSS